MLALARYALKSPFHASTIVGLLAIVSLFISPVSILCGAVVGLIILTQGLGPGARALLISLVGITVVSYLVTGSPMLGITIGLIQWVPMVILAEILSRTRSMSFTMVAGMVIFMLVVLLKDVFWPGVDKEWIQLFLLILDEIQFPLSQEQKLLLAQSMVLVVIAVMYSTFVATLLVSRWFQARLAESSGFRDEFYAIKLGKGAALGAVVLALLSLLLQMDMLTSMLMVMLVTFLYQGLAILHSWSKRKKLGGWLVLLYVLMVFIPQIVAIMALLGVVDNWVDFRARLKSSG